MSFQKIYEAQPNTAQVVVPTEENVVGPVCINYSYLAKL